MADKLVRGNSMDGAIRVFAAVTTDLVNEAQRIHHTYPVATAALGRLLTGAAIMGAAGLKNETDSMTVQIKGEGEITNLVAVTDFTVGSEVTFQTRMLTDHLTIKVNLMSAVLSAADI